MFRIGKFIEKESKFVIAYDWGDAEIRELCLWDNKIIKWIWFCMRKY